MTCCKISLNTRTRDKHLQPLLCIVYEKVSPEAADLTKGILQVSAIRRQLDLLQAFLKLVVELSIALHLQDGRTIAGHRPIPLHQPYLLHAKHKLSKTHTSASRAGNAGVKDYPDKLLMIVVEYYSEMTLAG